MFSNVTTRDADYCGANEGLRFTHSKKFADLAGALTRVQGSMGKAKKTHKNTHFKSNYATLEDCIDAAMPELQAEGIAVLSGPGVHSGFNTFTTMLAKGEEWVKSTSRIHEEKNGRLDPQALGAWITYTRRYHLASLLCMAQEDTDGDVGQNQSTASSSTASTPKPSTTPLFGAAAAKAKLDGKD